MAKKHVVFAGFLFALVTMSGSVLACGGENSGKHIGNITAVNQNGGTFTIRDMESNSPITFKANSEIMTAVTGASGHVMVNYEENDEGALVAVGVTF